MNWKALILMLIGASFLFLYAWQVYVGVFLVLVGYELLTGGYDD